MSNETGVVTVYKAPPNEDVDAQIKIIDQAISDNTSAIVIAPVADEELHDSLAKAIQVGIPIITIDSETTFSGVSSYVGTFNVNAGNSAGQYAINFINEMESDEATVAIISHGKESGTSKERVLGFTEMLNRYKEEGVISMDTTGKTENIPLEDVKNTVVLEPVSCDGDIEKAKENTIKLLEENPDIDVIFATNQPGLIGCCEAIEQLSKENTVDIDTISVVGFDYFNDSEKYLDSGVLDCMLVQNPYNMGYVGIKYAIDILHGESVNERLDTGVTLVTKDNISNDDVAFLINSI